MTYIGTIPATNTVYKASASNGQDAIESSITDNGTLVSISATNGLISNKLAINTGTNQQYMMADGSLLAASAQNGNANFYLYNNVNGLSVPPPASGTVSYNASTLAATTLVYISHLTRDNVDIDIYFALINTLDDLYIQDQSNSVNFAKFNITGAPILNPNNYITIPVTQVQFGGNGNTSFGANHDILVSFFSNLQEINTRITSLETKTQNQTAIPNTTTIAGILKTDDIRSTLGIPNDKINISSNLLNIGTSQTPNEIFNNGSSLTKNNFNTSQSVGCVGFKDNWSIASGNNASIKQGMIYMSNVSRVIVISNLTPQYFNDTTGALVNCTSGIYGVCSSLFIPSLGIAYSRNTTQYSTSSDGITWTFPFPLLGNSSAVGDLIYSPSLNLFVAQSGSLGYFIQTSSDGITWTLRFALRNVYTIIDTGTRLITFGSGGCMYSTDGITWINDTVQTNNIRAAIYCESLSCILAQIQGGNRNIIKSYDSGLTWTTLTNVFPFATASNKFVWDSVSGKAYNMTDDGLSPVNSYLFEFDASGSPALGGSIQMMGNTSNPGTSAGLTHYIYNPSIKRFLFTRNLTPHPVFYSTTSNNLAVSGNQYIIGSLNCSGGYNPYGLANIDIMLRDSPFIGIQFINGNDSLTALSNSLWTAFGSTSSTGSVFSLTNNYTRQLCCADWSFPTPANGQLCGFGSSATTGVRVSTGFNFGISAVLGYADTGYSPGIQNFFGLYNLSTAPALSSTVSIMSLLNCILFGSSTTDANICIYTADASTMVKQVDLGSNFPSNRTNVAASTDWFKLTLYWDTSKFYYKAHNTTTNVIVSGSFSSAAIPATSIQLYPQCLRAMGAAQTSNSCKLKVQRFGVYY